MTNMLALSDRINQFLRQILGVRGHETNSLKTRDLINLK